MDLEKILPMEKDYFTYLGSLTTPDFQENVVWMVLTEPIMVSQHAIDRMKELMYGGEESYKMTVNVRKMASLGDREVFRPAME